MAILYIISEKSSSIKNYFSDDLVDKLNNFKNYSPPWGLIGVDELKIIMNILGYENIFSKMIIPDDDNKNISNNKFISSGFLGFITNLIATQEKNITGLSLSIIIFVITIMISSIILFGISKI
jgi:hypothetical protein